MGRLADLYKQLELTLGAAVDDIGRKTGPLRDELMGNLTKDLKEKLRSALKREGMSHTVWELRQIGKEMQSKIWTLEINVDTTWPKMDNYDHELAKSELKIWREWQSKLEKLTAYIEAMKDLRDTVNSLRQERKFLEAKGL